MTKMDNLKGKDKIKTNQITLEMQKSFKDSWIKKELRYEMESMDDGDLFVDCSGSNSISYKKDEL